MYLKVNRIMFLTVALVVCIGLVPALSVSKEMPDPIEQLRPFIDKIVNVLTDLTLQGMKNALNGVKRLWR